MAAAIRLFTERGVAEVSLADIAREVGLARNSLYRYFPDKAHILAAWFRTTIAPLVAESEAIAASDAPVDLRLARWVDAQLDYLVAPDHAAMLLASTEMDRLPDDVRTERGAGHRELYSSLASIIGKDLKAARRDTTVVSLLIAALVRGAAEQIRAGAAPKTVRGELRRCALAAAGVS